MTDVCTRCIYAFTFVDKKPPVSTVCYFLKKYGKPNGTIRTDKDGELANSIDFQKMILHNNR